MNSARLCLAVSALGAGTATRSSLPRPAPPYFIEIPFPVPLGGERAAAAWKAERVDMRDTLGKYPLPRSGTPPERSMWDNRSRRWRPARSPVSSRCPPGNEGSSLNLGRAFTGSAPFSGAV